MGLHHWHSSLAQAHSSAFRALPGYDRYVVPGELVLGEELAHLQLHQLQQLGVVHHVGLVEEDHHGGDLHLAGEQDVLAGLGHGAVGGRYHQDGPVHLGGAGDHVLDVVGVARAVHVGVVAVGRLVLHVGDGDGDAPLLLLGSVVDGLEGAHLHVEAASRSSTLVMAAVSMVLPWST